MKKLSAYLIALTLLLSGCNSAPPKIEGTQINLSDSKITVDGSEITNDNTQAVYSANDIVFYPTGKDFTFGEGTKDDEHEQSEADAHTVVHITKPGKYILSGELSLGQIAVDLGEEAETNPEAVVTLILNGVDITCEVAPAIIFYNVYECCSSDEETATKDVDTSKAGANVIISDNTENNINGSYVAKIYESYELSEDGKEVVDSKKLHKYDGAFYSKKTMNVNGGEKGNGILNIKADNEGLDSELHLTINGGIINITAGNDGINTSEDNISVATVNGGTLNIVCDGGTGEGDGIDSNGWLVINGGNINAQACATSGDAGIDSDKGIYINGGNVVASGNMLDHIAGGEQTYAVFSFANRQNKNAYTLKNSDNKAVGEYAIENSFTYLIVADDKLTPDDYTFWQGDTQLTASSSQGMQGNRPEMPQGEPPSMPNGEPPQGEPPSMPNGEPPQGEPPSMPNGEPPQGEPPSMPNGEVPQGERPSMPKGEVPQGERPSMPNGEMPQGETSTTFTIKKDENYFTNIRPVS